MVFGSSYFTAQTPVIAERAQGKIVLILHKTQAPPALPYELNGHVSNHAWESRVPQIIKLTARYNHPILENIWLLLWFLLSFILPLALRECIYSSNRPLFVDHIILFAIFVAIATFFWAPLLLWKTSGQRNANALAARWATEDARNSVNRYNGYVPMWTIQLPTILRNQTCVAISVPQQAPPTSAYHPGANLPPWVLPPKDDDYFEDLDFKYDNKRSSRALSNSSLDALPLYDERGAPLYLDEKAPNYA